MKKFFRIYCLNEIVFFLLGAAVLFLVKRFFSEFVFAFGCGMATGVIVYLVIREDLIKMANNRIRLIENKAGQYAYAICFAIFALFSELDLMKFIINFAIVAITSGATLILTYVFLHSLPYILDKSEGS